MSLSDNIFSSPLWKRCDPIEEDDEATAIWDAWWGHDIEPDVKPFPVMPTSVAIGLGSREGAPLPATFRTIDLGSFLFGAAPGPIILRGDYETAIKALNEGHDRKKSRGALITGESGIGKTLFMWYLLRYRLSKKLPTLFCLRSWEPMLFREDGAFEPSSHRMAKTPKLVYAARDACRPENGRLWVLDDESKLKTEYDPPGRLNHGQVFLIQTTDVESHDEVVFQEWVQQDKYAYGYCPASAISLKPWTWDELVAAVSIQPGIAGAELDYPILQDCICRTGPVVRTVIGEYYDLIYFSGDDSSSTSSA